MGGSAFGADVPAARITTSNYHRLVALLTPRLSPYFNRIEHLRFFADKETHGDVDILCAWIAPAWAFVPLHKTSSISPAVRDEAEKGRREFVDEIAAVAGAPFYQVDLLLFPPHNFDFRLFNGSYSTTNIILGQAVRGIAYELTLREEDLILRHAPIDEGPRIDLVLTDDITEFCLWLGLDYTRWQQGFANRDAFWQFMITVPPGSKMAYSLKGLARKWSGGYTPPAGARPRAEEMTEYYAFLQETQWASLPTDTRAQPRSTKNGDSRDRKPYPLGVEVREIDDIRVLEKEIDKPSRWPLKPQALRALDYWGVRTEYFDLVAERRELKKVILRSRLRKVKRARWWTKVRMVLVRIKEAPRKAVDIVRGLLGKK